MRELLLRKQAVCETLNISLTTLWRWEKAGYFPKAKSIPGSSIKGWSETTVNNWIEDNFSYTRKEKTS